MEDNKNTARLMEVVLTQNGYSTLHASNGEEGLKMVDENHINLISFLLDTWLPYSDILLLRGHFLVPSFKSIAGILERGGCQARSFLGLNFFSSFLL